MCSHALRGPRAKGRLPVRCCQWVGPESSWLKLSLHALSYKYCAGLESFAGTYACRFRCVTVATNEHWALREMELGAIDKAALHAGEMYCARLLRN